MDHLRVLLVPFHVTSLILVQCFSVLLTHLQLGGLYGIFAQLFLQIWVVKYCYVLIETACRWRDRATGDVHGHAESLRDPSLGAARIIVAGTSLLHGDRRRCLMGARGVLLLLLPAIIAVLGVGEPFYQAVNPLTLLRMMRGLGPYYLLILVSIPVYFGILCAAGASRSGPSFRATRPSCSAASLLQPHRRLHLPARQQLGSSPAAPPSAPRTRRSRAA
jgi:hypothetical protein